MKGKLTTKEAVVTLLRKAGGGPLGMPEIIKLAVPMTALAGNAGAGRLLDGLQRGEDAGRSVRPRSVVGRSRSVDEPKAKPARKAAKPKAPKAA
jgi:hypothetical protein